MRKVTLTIETADKDAEELARLVLGCAQHPDTKCIADLIRYYSIQVGQIVVEVEKSEARRLAEAYYELFPKESPEITLRDNPNMDREAVWDSTTTTYQNWLDRLHADPSKALATQNWCGKVTQAYFRMKGVPRPRLKSQMIELYHSLNH